MVTDEVEQHAVAKAMGNPARVKSPTCAEIRTGSDPRQQRKHPTAAVASNACTHTEMRSNQLAGSNSA
jgi:hypothetical protein